MSRIPMTNTRLKGSRRISGGMPRAMLGDARLLGAQEACPQRRPQLPVQNSRCARARPGSTTISCCRCMIDGRRYLVSGMRTAPNEPFRYLRFPADEDGGIEGYMRLRATLFDKALRPEIARRFATDAMQGTAANEALRAKLIGSTVKVLEMFAHGGFDALAKFIERRRDQGRARKSGRNLFESAGERAIRGQPAGTRTRRPQAAAGRRAIACNSSATA